MSTNNLLKLVIPTATIESQIIEDLTTRLNLNDINEATYWINQVTDKKSVVDFLADQISAMIDSPINVRIPQSIPQADNAVKFDTVQALYEDMLNNCKSFTLGTLNRVNNNGIAVFGETIYSNYEFHNYHFTAGDNQLNFWQASGDDGAALTLFNVIGGLRIGDPKDNSMLEYRFYLKGKEKPMILLGQVWNYKGCSLHS